jgi:Laminin B (Domain IV)/PEP-CTERM motif
MRLQYILPAAAALLGLAGPASAASVSSTFDTGAEGWGVGDISSPVSTAPDSGTPPTYNATGGNPGGFISTSDAQNIVAFLAPSKFLGDDSAFLGGKLTFDLQDLVPADSSPYPAVVLYTSTGSISYTSISPGTSWTSFSIPLTAAGWTIYPGGESNGTVPVTAAEFAAALGGVVNLAIEADWHTGADDTGLDNVVLASGGGPSPVPEPSTWAMMITGLIGMAFLSLRGKRGVPVRGARA